MGWAESDWLSSPALPNGWALGAGVLIAAALAATAVPAQTPSTFFRDLAETRSYSLGQPVAPKFTPDGRAVFYLRGGARDPVLRLYAFEIAGGVEQELMTPEQVLAGAAETLSPEEKARRERARVSTRGFTRFEMSPDGAKLIVSLSGKLYLLTLGNRAVVELPGENWIDPQLSPDGKVLAAVKGHELYVIDLETRAVSAVTSGATDTLHHGVAEFVAQEEMSRSHGYWWSPDGAMLAYQENDESGVEVRHVADPLRPEAKPTTFFYPRAGSANTKVRLGLIARTGGPTTWVDWDRNAYPYLARVVWDEAAAPLTILVQDRAQQKQLLLAVDPKTGATRTLLTETDAAWLNLDDAEMPVWRKDGKSFLWTTERKGAWQVELRAASGKLIRAVTAPDFGYRRFLALDDARGDIYLQGGVDARESHVWCVALAGGKPQPLTSEAGIHAATFSDDRSRMVHTYQLMNGDVGAEVMAGDEFLVALPSAAENPPSLPVVEITQTSQGFDAAIVRPADFAVGKTYPVLLSVYAGPTAKMVTAARRAYFIDQWMADQGYVVVRLDGRGTPGRGRAWERAVRGNLIDVALQDQVAGLEALAAQHPELDLTRVGITGWSFGGYVSALAVMKRPDIFHAAVAGAPVVTWENYDTHYTERYLGTPQDNPEAYRLSNVTTYAKDLTRPLLLIHGLTDDNVYAQHTLQLIDALFLAGKPYEFMPMLGTHMISDPKVREARERRIMEFFARTLLVKPPQN